MTWRLKPSWMTVLTGVLSLAAITAVDASAQLVANGKSLTVTTANSLSTFAGADLIGFKNLLTNENYLKNASTGELAAVNPIAGTGQSLQTSNWVIGTESGTGIPLASITVSDSVRALTLTVKIDAATQETVIKLSAGISNTGLRDASWSMAGVDLAGGRLILPFNTGMVFDKTHSPLGQFIEYPTHGWNAQMGVYEGQQGSFIFYSTDTQMRFKQLRTSTRGSSTVDVALVTEALAPFTTAGSVPNIEWRLKAFSGDWRVAAQVYRDWLNVNRPPVSNAGTPWVSGIRAVVGIRSLDASLLAPLATKVVPSQTLLYVHDWRSSPYDVNYPDYTPRSGVASLVTTAHNLGFKVMLHFDMIGVSPGNPDYASLQSFQAKTPESLQLIGWQWDQPPSTPTRFAYINPASSAFRTLLISRIGVAVNAVHPDALHLDISAALVNDGNGLIDGKTYAQGAAQLHEDLIAAFPSVALAGEGQNDVLYRYESFAQAFWQDIPTLGHPIATFLFQGKTQYYGHLSQPAAGDPAFKTYLSRAERRAVLPQLPIGSAVDLDTTIPDNARLIALIQSWQNNAFQPDWIGSWAGALVKYQGSGNTVAALTDSGTVEALNAAGVTLYQLAHNVERLSTSTSFIPSWPAFDADTIYGLDASQLYWLVNMPRPDTTHVSSLMDGVRVGTETLTTTRGTHFALDRANTTAFDFYGELLNAVQGVRFQGTDGPLANGAVVLPTNSSVGGISRQVLFLHPPFSGQIGGETFVQYQIPLLANASFQFSVGIQDGAACNQDGVTFRVTANGAQVYQQTFGVGAWHDGTVDLSAYSNSTVLLRLISNPGPQNNPNCDWGVWSLLKIVYVPATPGFISVPLVLPIGSNFSGMSGDGSITMSSPQNGIVSSLPVPGHFTVFNQTGMVVGNGTNIANLSFEMFKASHEGLAGNATGCCPVGGATAGGVTKNPAIGAHPPDGGRTILAWVLRLPDAGSLRLGWSAGILDGAAITDGIDFSVLIDGNVYWKLTKQTNAWSAGTIDLAMWRGKNILLELITDSRTTFFFDWAEWTDLVLTNSVVTCTYTLSPVPPPISAAGSQLMLNVTASATCPWFVTSSVPWLSVTSGGSGLGNGTVNYTVAPNSGAPRFGVLTVAGQFVGVSQSDMSGNLPKRARSQITSQ